MTPSATDFGVSVGSARRRAAAAAAANLPRTLSAIANESAGAAGAKSSAVTTYSRNGSPLKVVVRWRGYQTPLLSSDQEDQVVSSATSPHIAQKTSEGYARVRRTRVGNHVPASIARRTCPAPQGN